MKRETLEKKIQREVEAAIGAEPDLLMLRNSCGMAKHTSDDGKTWHVPYGLGTGSPDLVGLLLTSRRVGLWFCLEVKALEGELSEGQIRCHEVWRKFGALIYVVRSAREAREALTHARSIARAS